MAKYANQEKVIIGEREPRDPAHPYAKVSIAAIQEAMSRIRSIGGLKLWLYFSKNADGYAVDLSMAELKAHWGLTKDTYYAGKTELKNLGYLTPVDGSDKIFLFSEFPKKVEEFSENQTKLSLSENLSEFQTRISIRESSSEIPKKDMDLSENPKDSSSSSEKQTNYDWGDFYF